LLRWWCAEQTPGSSGEAGWRVHCIGPSVPHISILVSLGKLGIRSSPQLRPVASGNTLGELRNRPANETWPAALGMLEYTSRATVKDVLRLITAATNRAWQPARFARPAFVRNEGAVVLSRPGRLDSAASAEEKLATYTVRAVSGEPGEHAAIRFPATLTAPLGRLPTRGGATRSPLDWF